MGIASFTRARDRLLAAQDQECSPTEICETVLRAMHDVIPFVAGAVMLTDSETTLPCGGVVEGFDREQCAPFWDNELLDPDFNKFRELLRSVDPVATLAEVVDGDLTRSPRHQKLYEACGATDELRTVFAVGPSSLAVGVFVQTGGRYSVEEIDDVREIVPVATASLRRSLRRLEADQELQVPAVVVLDEHDRISAITEGGAALLDDLRSYEVDEVGIPVLVRAAAMRARWSRSASTVTTRLVGRSGCWYRVHVAPLHGESRAVAATIERARPDDLVSILLRSYGFTSRETDVVVMLARGTSIKEIAQELCISIHTVRDHIKVVYDKAGVNSRGELMARLFTNHVVDRLHDSIIHVDTI